MACTDGKNTYLNIKELPEISDIIGGDFLIVETINATSILDFANFIITLDNTTFGDVITNNTTNIEILSSQVKTLSGNIETYAIFSLSGYNSAGPQLIEGSNITSVSFYTPSSAVRLNFTKSFTNSLYGFTTDSFLSCFAGPGDISDLYPSYIDIFIKDKNFNLTTTTRATVRIVGGQLA